MFKYNIKQLFLFTLVGLMAVACDDDSNPMEPEEHINADGFILESNETEMYREFQGAVIINNLNLNTNQTLDLTVHFLDLDGNEIEHEEEEHAEGEEEDELSFTNYDDTIISLDLEDEVECFGLGNNECDAAEHCMMYTSMFNDFCRGYSNEYGWDSSCSSIPDNSTCNWFSESYGCVWDSNDNLCEGFEDPNFTHHELGFELTGLSAETTTFTLSLMHNGHADYVSLPISVTVAD